MINDTKRFFFGFEIETLWPKIPQEKKLISEKNRHITLLFLGDVLAEDVEKHLNFLPLFDFKIAPVGFFDKILFLPKNQPRLVAYKANFMDKNQKIEKFQKDLFDFFKNKKKSIKQNQNFLPHVTICRNNFSKDLWEQSFEPFAFYIKSFNLFESLGHSEYKTLWRAKNLIKPFNEIPHTADIAFEIKGVNFSDLLYNAFIALSFKEKKILNFYKELKNVYSIDDVIINLNEIVTIAEIQGIHMPFKAISFHSDIKTEKDILTWEMIVDV